MQRVFEPMRAEQRDALTAGTPGARIQQEGAFARRMFLGVIELADRDHVEGHILRPAVSATMSLE